MWDAALCISGQSASIRNSMVTRKRWTTAGYVSECVSSAKNDRLQV